MPVALVIARVAAASMALADSGATASFMARIAGSRCIWLAMGFSLLIERGAGQQR
jgi:hypothetical protein